jgi:hypothetical protein
MKTVIVGSPTTKDQGVTDALTGYQKTAEHSRLRSNRCLFYSQSNTYSANFIQERQASLFMVHIWELTRNAISICDKGPMNGKCNWDAVTILLFSHLVLIAGSIPLHINRWKNTLSLKLNENEKLMDHIRNGDRKIQIFMITRAGTGPPADRNIYHSFLYRDKTGDPSCKSTRWPVYHSVFSLECFCVNSGRYYRT